MKTAMEEEWWDVVVVGAGAAGLAAAVRCMERGKSVVCLEAHPQRAGGRVRSEDWGGSVAAELGAELMHGSDICTRDLVRRHGQPVDEIARFRHLRYGAERSSGARMYASMERLKNEKEAQQRSLLDYLRRTGVVNNAAEREEANILLAQTWCCDIERLSVTDVQQDLRGDRSGSHATEGRLRHGYSALLVDCMARNVPIVLGARVTRLLDDKSGKTAAETADGRRFVAREGAIVTVAAPLLATIDFGGAMDDRVALVRQWVRMEPATKLVYQLERAVWDVDTTYLAAPQLCCRWWIGGPALLVCYVTAEYAATLDALPEDEALQLGLLQVAPLLGVAVEALRVVKAVRQSWAKEEFVGGGYCSVLPGAPPDIRQRFFEPKGRIFFAGEHTAFFSNPQTVHGAVDSGTRAADLLCRGARAAL
jgi:monoamine oxidase